MGLVFTFKPHKAVSWLRYSALLLWLSAVPVAFGQAMPAGSNYQTGVALTVGAINTQFPFYADNSAGGSAAIFFQKSTFVGVQAMGSVYPYSARFIQAPVTLGWRIGKLPNGNEPSLFTGWSPFAYAGAGFSYSQNSNYDLTPLPATGDPCVQVSFGVDHGHRGFMWRVMEVSWTRTYTSTNDLRSLGVSSGLVYNFQH
jgi:hypothetical protein